MTREIQSWLMDMDGVLVREQHAIPGASEFLMRLHARGTPFLVLTNNSLPAHIAAAVGTPVVDLYALTNVQHTPWAVPNRVLSVDVPCKGCRRSVCPLAHNRCLHAVDPRDVVDAILDLARETGMPERRRVPPRPETNGRERQPALLR